jgi:putative ABC transport system permease protein
LDIKIALRNVFRNRRRTAFSLTVIVLGVAILYFLLLFINEALASTKKSLACESGAVQIADERLFENTESGAEVLIDPVTLDRVVGAVQDDPGVIGMTWQLNFAGLIGDELSSTLIIGRGFIPCNCVNNYECIVIDGELSSGDASREIVIGRALAAKLDVELGNRVNIATGTISGNFNAATVTVVGLLTYSVETVEEQLGLVPLPFAQRLLRTDGVERILIGLEDVDEATSYAADVQARLDTEGIPLQARPWQELTTTYDSISTFYGAFSGLAIIAVFVLVFFSVLEVLTMSFLERTREVGTIRAFGTTRGRVFRSFLLEGIFLGAIGGLAGMVIGTIIALVFNAIGVTWTPPGAAIPQPLRVQITAYALLLPFFTAIASTFLSTLYPATKNARLRIVEALRSI